MYEAFFRRLFFSSSNHSPKEGLVLSLIKIWRLVKLTVNCVTIWLLLTNLRLPRSFRKQSASFIVLFSTNKTSGRCSLPVICSRLVYFCYNAFFCLILSHLVCFGLCPVYLIRHIAFDAATYLSIRSWLQLLRYNQPEHHWSPLKTDWLKL